MSKYNLIYTKSKIYTKGTLGTHQQKERKVEKKDLNTHIYKNHQTSKTPTIHYRKNQKQNCTTK